MKLSVSNIAWSAEQDEFAYQLMKEYGFSGLEIAPTRIFPQNPYDRLKEAKKWSEDLKRIHGFSIASIQSIWFGRKEKLFGTDEERKTLLDYTKRSIDFAAMMKCKNIVFGCPVNRTVPDYNDTRYYKIGIDFFRELGEYAISKGTVIGIEANPVIYQTNYINDTPSALKLIREVDSEGFLLNLDVGTMIQNKESLDELDGNINLINHVHISEPGLKVLQNRSIHAELKNKLLQEEYNRYVSVEIGRIDNLTVFEKNLRYVKSLLGK